MKMPEAGHVLGPGPLVEEAQGAAFGVMVQDGLVSVGEYLVGSCRASLAGEVHMFAGPSVEEPGGHGEEEDVLGGA
ncbi:hypothetical protein [Streptomyces sp. NPDC015350]|uniref:hypothetical protein n=1 Tax=Streptomyces sp. NPDC015350 TaxID=3364955 RepID=UPI0036FA226E